MQSQEMFFFEPIPPNYQQRRHFAIQNRPQHERHHFTNLLDQLSIDEDADNHPDSSHIFYDENGDFHVKCQVAGFKLDELSVDLDGHELVVSGEHKDKQDVESVERSFRRRIRLPDELEVQKMKCELDEEVLEMQVPRHEQVKTEKQRVHIEVKKHAEKP